MCRLSGRVSGLTLAINFVHSLKWLLYYCVWKIEYWFNGPWITANSFKKDSRIIRLIEDEHHRYIHLMDYRSWQLHILCFTYFVVFMLFIAFGQMVFSCLQNNWQHKMSLFFKIRWTYYYFGLLVCFWLTNCFYYWQMAIIVELHISMKKVIFIATSSKLSH